MTKVETIGGAVTLALLSTVLVSTATALPFTQSVSGGPTEVRAFVAPGEEVGSDPVFWGGPVPTLTGLTPYIVDFAIEIGVDTTLRPLLFDTIGVGTSYRIEFSPGDGVFSDYPGVEGLFAETFEVTVGEVVSLATSQLVSGSFLIEIDPAFDFSTDELFFVTVLATGPDYEDTAEVESFAVSFDGDVTVSEVPEPALGALFGLGAAVLALGARRRA